MLLPRPQGLSARYVGVGMCWGWGWALLYHKENLFCPWLTCQGKQAFLYLCWVNIVNMGADEGSIIPWSGIQDWIGKRESELSTSIRLSLLPD